MPVSEGKSYATKAHAKKIPRYTRLSMFPSRQWPPCPSDSRYSANSRTLSSSWLMPLPIVARMMDALMIGVCQTSPSDRYEKEARNTRKEASIEPTTKKAHVISVSKYAVQRKRLRKKKRSHPPPADRTRRGPNRRSPKPLGRFLASGGGVDCTMLDLTTRRL